MIDSTRLTLANRMSAFRTYLWRERYIRSASTAMSEPILLRNLKQSAIDFSAPRQRARAFVFDQYRLTRTSSLGDFLGRHGQAHYSLSNS